MFFYYLKLAKKSLLQTPITTALMVLAIALGIGVSMNALTLNHVRSANPIPEKSQQLFALQLQTMNKIGTRHTYDDMPMQITYQDAINIQRMSSSTRQVASVKTGFAIQMEDPDFAPILQAARATQSTFFEMFNIEFLYGGSWSKAIDESPDNQVVIAEELNEKLFGGGDNIGKNIYLNQNAYRIVGISKSWNPKPKFYDLNSGQFQRTEQIYVPFSLLPVHEYPSWGNNNGWGPEKIDTYQDKLNSEIMWIQYWVELVNNTEKVDFKHFLSSYVQQQKKLGRFERDDARGTLRNVEEWLEYNEVVGNDSNILVGISFMFLAVCLINTVGLLLAKFLKRAPEIGVRRALGANQAQVFLQHLVEVGVLGLLGGVLGLVIANIGLLILRNQFDGFDVLATMDMSMFIAAPVIAISATILSGLYPAWRVCTTLPSIHLKTQ
ncbi:MAG: ABC transporter permease [Colwellia sp.]|nr:ABC transporter permease [Colwellia sp.]